MSQRLVTVARKKLPFNRQGPRSRTRLDGGQPLQNDAKNGRNKSEEKYI